MTLTSDLLLCDQRLFITHHDWNDLSAHFIECGYPRKAKPKKTYDRGNKREGYCAALWLNKSQLVFSIAIYQDEHAAARAAQMKINLIFNKEK